MTRGTKTLAQIFAEEDARLAAKLLAEGATVEQVKQAFRAFGTVLDLTDAGPDAFDKGPPEPLPSQPSRPRGTR